VQSNSSDLPTAKALDYNYTTQNMY